MKVNNINTEDQYPEDYDWLLDSKQKTILDFFNYFQNMADEYYEKHKTDAERRERYLDLYNQTIYSLLGAKELCSLFGVMVEYNWPTGPENEWFLATKADWQAYEDYKVKCCPKEPAVVPYSGWPSPIGNKKTDCDCGCRC